MGLTGQALTMSRQRIRTCDCCGKEVQYDCEGDIPENDWREFYGVGELWCIDCWNKLEAADSVEALDKLQRLDDTDQGQQSWPIFSL